MGVAGVQGEKGWEGGDVDHYFLCCRGTPRKRAAPGKGSRVQGRREEQWHSGCMFEDSKLSH